MLMYPEGIVSRLVVMGTMVSLLFIVFTVAVMLTLSNRLNRKNKDHVRALVHEKERTMHTISVEIHDNILQQLYLAKIKLHLLHDSISGNHQQQAVEALAIIDKLMADSSSISHSLNNEYLRKKRLLPALTEDVTLIDSDTMHCKLTIEGTIRPLAAEWELMIYRIAQEAIRNAMKHSGAKALVLSIYYHPEDFKMTISDDGKGFDYNNPLLRAGIGMSSMDQRAKLLGGSLAIQTFIGQGTSVILLLPGILKKSIKNPDLLRYGS